MSKKIKVLSLFDGISCARVALEAIGYEVEYYASEIDKYALTVTQLRYPDTIQIGDVQNVSMNLGRLEFNVGSQKHINFCGPFDLLIGGSPCQDLSIAKVGRKGLAGDRSGLFFDYVRILKEVKPKYFVLENVASMSKASKERITELMGVEPIMINAALVSAQARKRLFWTNIPNIEQPADQGIMLKDIIQNGVVLNEKSKTITASYKNGTSIKNVGTHRERQLVWLKPINLKPIQIGTLAKGMSGRIYSLKGKSVTLKAGGGGSGAKTGLYDFKEIIFARASVQKNAEQYSDKSPTLTGAMGMGGGNVPLLMPEAEAMKYKGKYLDGEDRKKNGIRPLTPIECERLQSLPDDYTTGISKTQRYKSLGNAFNVEVVKHILSYMDLK